MVKRYHFDLARSSYKGFVPSYASVSNSLNFSEPITVASCPETRQEDRSILYAWQGDQASIGQLYIGCHARESIFQIRKIDRDDLQADKQPSAFSLPTANPRWDRYRSYAFKNLWGKHTYASTGAGPVYLRFLSQDNLLWSDGLVAHQATNIPQ